MFVYDTETVGLHGMPVLLQYAKIEDGPKGPITLYEIWYEPVWKTKALIEQMMNEGVIGFNLSFDHFMLCKLYTIWCLLPDDWRPVDHIEEIALLEPQGRDGLCLKPRHCLDLMMHARKGPYQSTMDRKPICIRRVPIGLAPELVAELESRVELKDIYFAKRKDKRAAKWAIYECKDRDTGVVSTDFVNVMLKFRPSSSLKAIAEDIWGTPTTKFVEIEVDHKYRPVEYGYAPFALAVEPSGTFRESWPAMIRHHINHWRYRKDARTYAENDIVYTRGLYYEWNCPPMDDDDSVLTCMVAAVRWRGYRINTERVRELKASKAQLIKEAPRSAQRVKDWIWPDLTPDDIAITKNSTCKVVLEDMQNWKNDDGTPHAAAPKAAKVMAARKAEKEMELYDKLLAAGRFHASFTVIGALSSRMSGSGGDLNSQGIKKTKEVRRCFPLAFTGFADAPKANESQVQALEAIKLALGIDLSKYSTSELEDFALCGGDFESFEVTIADAVWGDPKLHEDLQNGKSIHGIFGTFVFPHLTYAEIMASKGTANDYYTKCKSAVFAMLYGGEGYTLKSRLGVDIETADMACSAFANTYPCIRRQQDMLTAKFCTITQPNGRGSRVFWRDPDDYIETILGDRRYFTVENKITKILFDLSEKPPAAWSKKEGKCVRYETEQKLAGAVKSALFGACFNMQSGIKRAAGNHLIQSVGARLTKRVQAEIWAIQSYGITPWLVQPMNIHDEIMCPTYSRADFAVACEVKRRVDEQVEIFRKQIPLIGMEWATGLSTWADK